MPRSAGEGDQRRGNKRGKAAADHARHLVADAGAAIAIAGAEQLGKHRLLDADHHIMGDIGQHQGEEQDPENGLTLQRHKERETAQSADQRPGDIDPPTAKAVCQPGEAGDSQAAKTAHQQANVEKQLARQAEVLRGVVEGEGGDDIHRQQLTQTQGDNQ